MIQESINKISAKHKFPTISVSGKITKTTKIIIASINHKMPKGLNKKINPISWIKKL